MTLQAMLYFIQLAECASFTHAARKLYISQPTLSRQIKNLEEELCVELVERSEKKPVRLTPEGEIFLEEVRKITAHVNRIPEMIHKRNLEHLSISIGYHSSFNGNTLHRTIAAFSQSYPAAKIGLRCCDSNTLNQGLNNKTFDIILIAEFCMESCPGICAIPISQYELCAAVSVQHPLAAQGAIALGKLKDEKFVFLERRLSPVSMDRFASLCAQNGFFPNIVESFQDKSTMLIAIGANSGISLTLSGPPTPSTVKLIPIAEPKVRGHYCAVHLSHTDNAAVPLFISVLNENLKQSREL